MKKRPLIICLVVLVLGSLLFWLESNCIITGWLKGEAFYQGRPTSYWRRELEFVPSTTVNGDGSTTIFFRRNSSFPEWFNQIIGRETYSLLDLDFLENHPLWMGDPQARDVLIELTELTEGSTSWIRHCAKEGLARIKQ